MRFPKINQALFGSANLADLLCSKILAQCLEAVPASHSVACVGPHTLSVCTAAML